MAKRNSGLSKQSNHKKSHSHKTKKRLAIKRLFLENRKKKGKK
ncbi:MAG: hypothetical protein UT53_C0007G0004 [Candidatus Yanofskybacteria bacterium GW2011_GWD2_39_48]|uniref:Uncharacterized protein n=1 Tax=Candidatus Yanofskybacteria bacterium GW2011_GWD2_39_48 TaxID=1619031 RepID=A0A0G0PF36_9BACT|nr:MAG: hypothetical protein UT53_C0007G0004 [Candidatus Yanofskybacteria bacterium GW2011_GWD2_39_48]